MSRISRIQDLRATALGSGIRMAAVARVAQIGIRIGQVFILIRLLSLEQYGVWATLVVLANFTAFSDLGIGNGLLNLITRARAAGDESAQVTLLSNALFLLGVIAVAVAGGLTIATFGGMWNWVTNHDSPETIQAGLIITLMFAVSLPLTAFQKILLAHQLHDRYYKARLALEVVSIAILGLMWALQVDMLWLVVAATLVPIWGTNLVNLYQVRDALPWLRGSLRLVSVAHLKSLLASGGLFLVLALVGVAAFQIDFVVISRILGPEAVPLYSVPLQLFFLLPQTQNQVLSVLWPAYGDAWSRGDVPWMRRTLWRSILWVLGTSIPMAAVVFVLSPGVVTLWAGPDLAPDVSMRVALALWALAFPLMMSLAYVLHAMGVVRFQVITGLVMAIANLALSVLFVKAFGPEGVAFGSVLSTTICVILPSAILLSARLGAPTTRRSHGTTQL